MRPDDAHALVHRLMTLWSTPAPDRADFAALYADPVIVNGAEMSLDALMARAAALHRSHSGIRAEVLDVVAAPERVVVGFLMHLRHTGPLPTPWGELPATGRTTAVRTIDILTVRDQRVTAITVVSDELGLLTTLGATPGRD